MRRWPVCPDHALMEEPAVIKAGATPAPVLMGKNHPTYMRHR